MTPSGLREGEAARSPCEPVVLTSGYALETAEELGENSGVWVPS